MHMSKVKSRLMGLGKSALNRKTQARAQRLDRENMRLRSEVVLLRDDLTRERQALADAIERLANGSRSPGRGGRVLRAMLVAGGAYLLGTRSGQERYEQIVGALRGMATESSDGCGTWTGGTRRSSPMPVSPSSRSRSP